MVGIAAEAVPGRTEPVLRRLVRALPQGRGLPAGDWERRHRGLLAVLWLHVVLVPVFGILMGYGVGHSVLEGCVLLAAALAAGFTRFDNRIRSGAVSVGLLTASGLLVHFSGGFIEFHFHFFVMIALLTLYVDWFPFLLAVAYVLGHHGIVGVLDPAAVYNHPDAIAHPWKWAGIHAGFVLAAGAASIFTWRISEEEVRRRTNIERVTEAALAKLPLGRLLEETLGRISEVVQADIAAILLREDGDLVLRSAHGAGPTPDQPIRLSADEGFHAGIVASQSPAVLAEVDPQTLENPIHRASGIRALAGVPLLVEGTLIGVLDVASTRPRRFTATDLDLLQLVADRVAPAIDRARLYEQEHLIAATLQRSLLPKRLPDIPGMELAAAYLPAGEHVSVGGDWYDAMELADARIALVMGDVAGHGSEAAALMGQLRTGLRAYATEGHPPDIVVGRLNTLLCGLNSDSMATLLYLELDLASWRGRLVNAGHPPPVLLEANGACRLLEGAHAAPLGVIPYTAYSSEEFDLLPGATLALYTDGLVERRDTPLPVSLDALCHQIAAGAGSDAETICQGVIATALEDGPLADDLAALVVRRTPDAARTFSMDHPAEPSAMPAIRRRLEHFLRCAGAAPEEIYEIVTSACEACANAIQHAYGARDANFRFSATIQDGDVRLVVADTGQWREPVDELTGGRGLQMMQTLMDDVDVERTEHGTQVTLRRRIGTGSRNGLLEHG